MEITKDILYVGVNDHLVDLFEGQYDVPNGMAYNLSLIHILPKLLQILRVRCKIDLLSYLVA